jgi:hypothetical protein
MVGAVLVRNGLSGSMALTGFENKKISGIKFRIDLKKCIFPPGE